MPPTLEKVQPTIIFFLFELAPVPKRLLTAALGLVEMFQDAWEMEAAFY